MFENDIKGGAIPKEYIPPIEQGIKEALETRRPGRLPDGRTSRSSCYDGSFHEVDSSEMAFKIAGSMAFKEAAQEGASPMLLEPIMEVEVVVPEDYMGDVIGDLNSRRGHIERMEPRGGVAGHHGARAPVGDVRLLHDLRSMTQGRGNYSMQFARYDEVPATSSRRDHREGQGSRSRLASSDEEDKDGEGEV